MAEIRLRKMERTDLKQVALCDAESFTSPWKPADYWKFLEANCVGVVVEDGKQVVGFVFMHPQRFKVDVLKLCVNPGLRRLELGSRLMWYAMAMAGNGDRTRVVLSVNEYNLEAQLFLRHLEFHAVATTPGCKKEGNWIRFVWRRPAAKRILSHQKKKEIET